MRCTGCVLVCASGPGPTCDGIRLCSWDLTRGCVDLGPGGQSSAVDLSGQDQICGHRTAQPGRTHQQDTDRTSDLSEDHVHVGVKDSIAKTPSALLTATNSEHGEPRTRRRSNSVHQGNATAVFCCVGFPTEQRQARECASCCRRNQCYWDPWIRRDETVWCDWAAGGRARATRASSQSFPLASKAMRHAFCETSKLVSLWRVTPTG